MATVSQTQTLFVSVVLIILASFPNSEAQFTDFLMSSCSITGNYSANSTYRANLETLLSSLASHSEITYGFYNSSAGSDPDRVYAVAHCRADLDPVACRACVNGSTSKLLATCPDQKEAMGWFERCMVRYSDKPTYGVFEYTPRIALISSTSVENKTMFNERLQTLVYEMRDEAASGDSERKDARSNITLSPFVIVYGLSQCTPDLSRGQCVACLDWLAGYIPTCCDGRKGARIGTPSCYLRYEDALFYGLDSIVPPPPPPPPPLVLLPPPPANGERSKTSRTALIIAVPIVTLGILVICVSTCIYFRSKSKSTLQVGIPEDITRLGSLQFDLGAIRDSTDNFCNANKLGNGRFGAVFKGRLRDGQEIAVKRLDKDSGQGDLEFKKEVSLVAPLQHRNLVRLLGFCLEKNERLLVYEFMHNSSLDHYLFDAVKRQHLDWERRYKIIVGIARGLVYLHEESRIRIIHRDLKASNILLDAEMNAKISDFGTARFFGPDQTRGDTSTIVGTNGYMAPEYAMHGEISVKIDVFSFGVLVLELIAGQKNNVFWNGEHAENLLSSAWKNWREGTALNLVDPTVRESGSRSEMTRCIHIGLLCVQEDAGERPDMTSVVVMLSSCSHTLAVPLQPGLFMHTAIDPSLEESSLVDYLRD